MIDPKELKVQSEDWLRSHDIVICDHLPEIETMDELNPPCAGDVCTRAFVLSHMIGVYYNAPKKDLRSGLNKNRLWDHLSKSEKTILSKKRVFSEGKYSDTDKNNCGWLPEAVQVFAWALNKSDLNHFEGCADDLADSFPPNIDPWPIIEEANLRSFEDIYQTCDLIYRLRWASKHRRSKGGETKLNDDHLMERHKAINWLVGLENDWDLVPTDI